jgi:hypothetical protein
MAEKDEDGNYYLKYDGSDICSQCRLPIVHGDKIFTDAVGKYLKLDGQIELNGFEIYHYKCIIIEKEDLEE